MPSSCCGNLIHAAMLCQACSVWTQISLADNASDVRSGRYTEEATFKGIADFTVEREIAFPVLTECRVVSVPARCKRIFLS